ncbi:MAG: hypothetical protein ABSE95_04290 [Thermodesulfobacteriota bacterium]
MNLKLNDPEIMVELFVSCLISFFWVGFYHYHYNISFFNSRVINWWAFLLWSSGLFITNRFYHLLKLIVRMVWVRIVLLWLAYFSILLLVEYLGYYVIGIREMTSEKPLLFGLIHGTIVLKIYYLIAGIVAIFLSGILKKATQIIFFSEKEQIRETPHV